MYLFIINKTPVYKLKWLFIILSQKREICAVFFNMSIHVRGFGHACMTGSKTDKITKYSLRNKSYWAC